MYIEKEYIIKWLQKEFETKIYPNKPQEVVLCCPFCERNEKHWDYSFNVEKMLGKCWRGFSSECESGHNLLTFVSFYYKISISKAKIFISSKFQSEDSVQRVKKHLKCLSFDRTVECKQQEIRWDMPIGSECIMKSKSAGAKKAHSWLMNIRLIPEVLIELIEPRYVGKNISSRWEKHYNRVLFPVYSTGNTAWLSYSMLKKSTKEKPKTLNPPGNILSNMLYLCDFYAFSNKPILLCEGIFDALRMFSFGFNAVAVFGTSLSIEQVAVLNSLKTEEAVVCLDSDAYGTRTNKMANFLKQYFFGDVSIMKIKDGDPDLLKYKQAHRIFKCRKKFSVVDKIKGILTT